MADVNNFERFFSWVLERGSRTGFSGAAAIAAALGWKRKSQLEAACGKGGTHGPTMMTLQKIAAVVGGTATEAAAFWSGEPWPPAAGPHEETHPADLRWQALRRRLPPDEIETALNVVEVLASKHAATPHAKKGA